MGTWSGRAEDGATVRVDMPDGHDDQLASSWPPLGLTGPDATGAGTPADAAVGLDPATLAQEQSADQTWTRLESDLALFAADHLVGRIAIHAALLTWRDRTLLLPGPSRAGKSTLALALADLGATVWTDEYALIDPGTGKATGWPRPVRRRRADGGVDRIQMPEADADQGPVSVDLVAVLRFDADASTPAWTTSTPADVVQHLLANTVNARRHPDLALDAALAIARNATGLEGDRQEAADAARRLADRIDGLG